MELNHSQNNQNQIDLKDVFTQMDLILPSNEEDSYPCRNHRKTAIGARRAMNTSPFYPLLHTKMLTIFCQYTLLLLSINKTEDTGPLVGLRQKNCLLIGLYKASKQTPKLKIFIN